MMTCKSSTVRQIVTSATLTLRELAECRHSISEDVLAITIIVTITVELVIGMILMIIIMQSTTI